MKEVAEIGWHVLTVTGWGIAWRIALAGSIATVLGTLLLVFCFRYLGQHRRISLGMRHDKYYRWSMQTLWVIAIPILSIATGALAGAWWAGNHAIDSEKLGERVGKSAFKIVVAGMVANSLDGSQGDRAKYAKELIDGKERLSVKSLSVYSSHHLGELSAVHLRTYLPHRSENLHRTTAWAVEKSLDAAAYYQLSGQGDAVYKLVTKVAAHDRETDNDGYVTVTEVADVACETFLDRGTKALWATLVLQFLLPVVGGLALVVLGPTLLAWTVRRFRAWRESRQSTTMSTTPMCDNFPTEL